MKKNTSIATLSIIQMRDVSASYDSQNFVLKNVSMNVKRGTNYAIVGVSGSGKCTLLKLMNGMMIPSSGVVLYNYQKPDLKNKEYKKSIAKIGYISQTLGLVKNSSVLDNVLIGALPRLNAVFLIIIQNNTATRNHHSSKCFLKMKLILLMKF